MFVDRCLSFCTFSFFLSFFLVLSVLLRYTDSDYPFGIFKLFSSLIKIKQLWTNDNFTIFVNKTHHHDVIITYNKLIHQAYIRFNFQGDSNSTGSSC